VDVGYQQSGVLVWAVIPPNSAAGPNALEGHYGGGAEGSFGVGSAIRGCASGSAEHRSAAAANPVSPSLQGAKRRVVGDPP